MKGLLAHKWVVAVAALVLTLAIGAGAWAVTGKLSTRPAGPARRDSGEQWASARVRSSASARETPSTCVPM